MDARAVSAARAMAALVEVTGPDPKLVKAAASDFYKANNGATTVSASGTLVTPVPTGKEAMLVVCPAELLTPFLREEVRRGDLTTATHDSLLPMTKIKVTVAGGAFPARLAGVFEVDGARGAVGMLTGSSWEAGWQLSSGTPAAGRGRGGAQAHLAVLQLQGTLDNVVNREGDHALVGWAESIPRVKNDRGHMAPQLGSWVAAVGSPFGALSPHHFGMAVFTGVVANVVHEGGSPALLMVDARCAPGMEGGPLVDSTGFLAGIITVPVRNISFHAEIPLAFCATRVATSFAAWHNRWQNASPTATPALPVRSAHALPLTPTASQQATTAGRHPPAKPWDRPARAQAPLVLTQASAHDAAPASGFPPTVWAPASARTVPPLDRPPLDAPAGDPSTSLASLPCSRAPVGMMAQDWSTGVRSAQSAVVAVVAPSGAWASGVVISAGGGIIITNAHLLVPGGSAGKGGGAPRDTSAASGASTVQVQARRAGGGQGWLNADVVYVFHGALDLAVVRLRRGAPAGMRAIQLKEQPAWEGEPAAVVGFPLMSPYRGFGPIVTAGNVVRVVREGMSADSPPLMLLTSAGVHAGASGGAVIDGGGCLLGLVTSNARHSGGRLLQHLNFSIAAAALQPLFAWANQPRSSQTIAALQTLDVDTPALRSVWALTSPQEEVINGSALVTTLPPPKAQMPALLAKMLEDNAGPTPQRRPLHPPVQPQSRL